MDVAGLDYKVVPFQISPDLKICELYQMVINQNFFKTPQFYFEVNGISLTDDELCGPHIGETLNVVWKIQIKVIFEQSESSAIYVVDSLPGW